MAMPDIIDLTMSDDMLSGNLAPLQPAKRKKRGRMPAGRCARRQRSNEAAKHKFKAVLHLLGAAVRRKERSEPEAYQYYYKESSKWEKDSGNPLDRIMAEVVWISVRDRNGLQFRLHGEASDELWQDRSRLSDGGAAVVPDLTEVAVSILMLSKRLIDSRKRSGSGGMGDDEHRH
ncbi:hypothetical protein PG991_001753 [Apiospora marii]|uniref:Uncharacterized protein n=1 Tax=Apiospora marii TaxID=335849 RepID=A0ABR1SQL1_9PEZI